jgi:hypothetical protein
MLAMFEKYVGSLFTKAQNRDERRGWERIA